jgi:hypothetical protein
MQCHSLHHGLHALGALLALAQFEQVANSHTHTLPAKAITSPLCKRMTTADGCSLQIARRVAEINHHQASRQIRRCHHLAQAGSICPHPAALLGCWCIVLLRWHGAAYWV